MKLSGGIKIYSNIEGLRDRLRINSGVVRAEGYDPYNESSYINNAYKASALFRRINKEEEELLCTEENNGEYSDLISLWKLPRDIIDCFEKLNLTNCTDRNEVVQRLQENEELTGLISAKAENMLRGFAFGEFKFHSLGVNKPELQTISRYYDRAEASGNLKYLGLHIDHSTDFTFATASSSKNRVCINLSSEPRRLLFINLTVTQIYEMLSSLRLSSQLVLNDIEKLFFEYYPQYPVIEITQYPYEFYIAPTDNCIHDGTTLSRSGIDIALTFTGYFKHNCN
jgi:hypothetical protein